jgi:hypothetical protein
MRVSLLEDKELAEIAATPQEVSERLMIGLEVGPSRWRRLWFESRHPERPDCLSTIGIARNCPRHFSPGLSSGS